MADVLLHVMVNVHNCPHLNTHACLHLLHRHTLSPFLSGIPTQNHPLPPPPPPPMQRSVSATAMNEQSSRSHMVFMLAVEGVDPASGIRMRGALNLIDLAGSERLARSGVTGERLKETTAINKSLSALGGCQRSAPPRLAAHVPDRVRQTPAGAAHFTPSCTAQTAAAARGRRSTSPLPPRPLRR
jgi:hypothetical protein